MRIVIAGGHGKIALLLENQLSEAGHEAIGIIRNPAHAADVIAAGGTALLLDLEAIDAATLADSLSGVDAVVFAAGAGGGSTAERKLTVDRDGAILLADAAAIAGVKRIVIVSAMSADTFDPNSDDVFQVYLRAKSEADAAVRATDLDWTIVRPGGLTDDAGMGHVTVGETVERGSIPRADVAAVIASLLTTSTGIGKQFELISGPTAIADLVL